VEILALVPGKSTTAVVRKLAMGSPGTVGI
jgi:hypothetical protein